MELTKRDFKKPELIDPADIRDLNENTDSLEEHLNAIMGYEYGQTITAGTDSVEINKIHLNKISGDPGEGRYYLVTAGLTWDVATKEIFDVSDNTLLEEKLDKGVGLSPQYDTAKKIEDEIESFSDFDNNIEIHYEGAQTTVQQPLLPGHPIVGYSYNITATTGRGGEILWNGKTSVQSLNVGFQGNDVITVNSIGEAGGGSTQGASYIYSYKKMTK